MTPKNVVITDPDEEQETTNNAVPDEDVPEDVEDVDVDVEGSVDNPFADVPADQMPVDEIPIEIRTEEDMEEGGTGHGMPDEAGNATKPLEDPIFDDGLLDDTVEFEITGEVAKRQEYFQPVTSEDRATIAKYCGITMPVMPTGKIEPVFTGRGRLCRNPGRPRHPVEPDGACYFHALSFLITGKENFDLLLRKHICDYVCDPANLHRLRRYIPGHYRSGEDWIRRMGMRKKMVWATWVEIFATAQMLQTDVVIWYNDSWERFPASGNQKQITPTAFYMTNQSQNHFDPITDM